MELWFLWIKIAVIGLLGMGIIRFGVHWMSRTRSHPRLKRTAAGAMVSMSLIYISWLVYAHIGYNSDLAFSPDGQYVARIMISPGTAIDSEFSSVIVRKAWSPWSRRAFVGDGWLAGGGEASPHVHWGDNSHLVIDFSGKRNSVTCAEKIDAVFIECRAHEWE